MGVNTISYWLICPNSTEVRRFTKKIENRDKSYEYIFIDMGIIMSVYGDKPPLIKSRKKVGIEDARKEWGRLISNGWQVTLPKWI